MVVLVVPMPTLMVGNSEELSELSELSSDKKLVVLMVTLFRLELIVMLEMRERPKSSELSYCFLRSVSFSSASSSDSRLSSRKSLRVLADSS